MDITKTTEALDAGCFTAFWHVAQTLNFTAAAKAAHMTQSGVSQHVARLEQQLGAPLFQRTNRHVTLTEGGRKLKQYLQKYYDELSALKSDIAGTESTISGLVRYAMPTSCLMSPHFDMLLAERRKEFPGVHLQVEVCDNNTIEQRIFSDQIDFGFLTQKPSAPQLDLQPYCLENYVLVGRKELLPKSVHASDLAAVPFVVYPGMATIYDIWRKGHGVRSAQTDWNRLTVTGEMSDLYGIMKMLRAGVGCAIMAEHCVMDDVKNKALHVLHPSDGKVVTNQIYIASRRGVQQPKRVQRIIDEFFAML